VGGGNSLFARRGEVFPLACFLVKIKRLDSHRIQLECFPIVVLNEQRGFEVQRPAKLETKTRMPQSLFSKH
jgi:hypothetical protein